MSSNKLLQADNDNKISIGTGKKPKDMKRKNKSKGQTEIKSLITSIAWSQFAVT